MAQIYLTTGPSPEVHPTEYVLSNANIKKRRLVLNWNIPSAQKDFIDTLQDSHKESWKYKRGPVMGSGNSHAWKLPRSLYRTRSWELRMEQARTRHQAQPNRLVIFCFLSKLSKQKTTEDLWAPWSVRTQKSGWYLPTQSRATKNDNRDSKH